MRRTLRMLPVQHGKTRNILCRLVVLQTEQDSLVSFSHKTRLSTACSVATKLVRKHKIKIKVFDFFFPFKQTKQSCLLGKHIYWTNTFFFWLTNNTCFGFKHNLHLYKNVQRVLFNLIYLNYFLPGMHMGISHVPCTPRKCIFFIKLIDLTKNMNFKDCYLII